MMQQNDSREFYHRRGEREPRHEHKNSEYRRDSRYSSRKNRESPSNFPVKSTIEGSRSVDLFEKVEQIGEGTYGKVYMGRNKQTGDIVALKKILMESEKEGFPITAIREIKILKQLRHKNIVQLKEIVTESKVNPQDQKPHFAIYMVFEYMEHDLAGLMQAGLSFTLPQIKCYMQQLLEGLYHCHKYKIIHRDIKGANLLIDNRGQLKLADFGLARTFYDDSRQYTNRVITLWYRPPELLLGAHQYGPEIDMWGVGCILAELLDKNPIFPGKDEADQLERIFSVVGTPNEENWPEVDKLPWWKTKKITPQPSRLREKYRHFNSHALDLLEKLLTLNPKKRITAAQALDSEWFWSLPLPLKPEELPSYPVSNHEYQVKQRNKRRGQHSVPLVPQQIQQKRPRTGGYPPPGSKPYPPSSGVTRQPLQNSDSRVPPSRPRTLSQPRPPSRSSSSSNNNRTQMGHRPSSKSSGSKPSNGPSSHSQSPSN